MGNIWLDATIVAGVLLILQGSLLMGYMVAVYRKHRLLPLQGKILVFAISIAATIFFCAVSVFMRHL